MALPALAGTTDLLVRGVDVSDSLLTDRMLAAASEAIRSAAGCPISKVTSTVTLRAGGSCDVMLPGHPVTSVTSVTQSGQPVSGWEFCTGTAGYWLHLPGGWAAGMVTVTYTHGLLEVPADIVDLTCRLVASSLAEVQGGSYGSLAGLQSRTRAIDDYRETDTYETGSAGVLGVIEVPRPTREWLRARFTGGVYTTGVR